MTTAAVESFLRRLLLRSSLDQDERNAVLSLNGEIQHVRPNRDIIRPGEHTDTATLTVNGNIARYDAMRDGDRQTTAIYLPGDMCDLHSVVAPVAGWGLTALNKATIMKIPHDEIRIAATRFPRLAFAFWRDTVVDSSILAKWIGNLGRRSSRARLAHLLCELGIRLETAGLARRDQFWLDLSQGQMADILGLTPVHVNRTVQELRRDGLIESDGRNVRVPDWPQLCAAAEFDPVYLLLP